MSYEGQERIGVLVREAAKTATHDTEGLDDADDVAAIERVNNIQVGEAFVAALADSGCMITRIPTKPASHKEIQTA